MSLPPVRDDLRLLEGYHSPQVEVEVRLNTNESPYPPPPALAEELAEVLRHAPLHRYPERDAGALRAALAEHHGLRPNQVLAANGSNEALQLLLLAFGGPGRTAVVFEPTYALHSHIARITGTSVVTGQRRDDFTLDIDEVAGVLRDAKPAVTFLCSPNNPTGRSEPRELIEAVLEMAPGLLVVDEAYGQFSRWSAVSLLADHVPLAVVRTYSKTWALAGLRLGYSLASPGVITSMEQVALPYHLDVVKQEAGRLALRYRAEMEGRVEAVTSERRRIAQRLETMPVDVWPSDANFLLFRPHARDGSAVWGAMVERSVLVRDCGSWPGLQGCLRVTVGTPEENDRFLIALQEALT